MKFLIPFLFPLAALQAIPFDQAAEEIVQAGVFLNQWKLCPATAGNFSRRIDGDLIAITASGKHKGYLTSDDILLVNLEGVPQETGKKPSAETVLHTILYQQNEQIRAVLHSHTTSGIILTRLFPDQSLLVTEGYEIHKVF